MSLCKVLRAGRYDSDMDFSPVNVFHIDTLFLLDDGEQCGHDGVEYEQGQTKERVRWN